MTKRKYKMTGCARFFLILIIVVPLAYMAASYINGQDGLANLKNIIKFEWLQGSEITAPQSGEEVQENNASTGETLDLKAENQRLREALEEARDSIRMLHQQDSI